MKKLLLVLPLLLSIFSYAQDKKLWAKSYLNQEAPPLVVEKWLSEKPETKGKFLIIDFWATWCGPCKKAIPELNEFQKEFKDQLIVIGLSDETQARVKKMTTPVIDYYSAIDTKKRTKRSYEVRGIPHCVIINPKGIVVWEGWPHLKGFELTSNVIKRLIKDY